MVSVKLVPLVKLSSVVTLTMMVAFEPSTHGEIHVPLAPTQPDGMLKSRTECLGVPPVVMVTTSEQAAPVITVPIVIPGAEPGFTVTISETTASAAASNASRKRRGVRPAATL